MPELEPRGLAESKSVKTDRGRLLGLTRDDEAVLAALVDRSALGPAELQDQYLPHLSPAEAEAVMIGLSVRGLITTTGDSGARGQDRYQVVDPSIAFRSDLTELGQRIDEARSWIDELSLRHRNRSSMSADSFVEVISDVEVARELVRATHAAATVEVLAMERPPYLNQPGPAFQGRGNLLEQEDGLLRRGVTHRVIYEQQTGRADDIVSSVSAGEQARVCDSLPMRTLIIDRTVAFLPARRGALLLDPLVVVHPGSVLDGLLYSFEMCWDRSLPVGLEVPEKGDPPLDPSREAMRQLVQLMALGLSDEAIAARLGVSLRTAQRRIAELLRVVGVRSRFQAGMAAARQGLL